MDPSVNFAALDDYMEKANAKGKARINQEIYNHVSDMAVINEVIFAIRSEKLRDRKDPQNLKAYAKEAFRVQWITKIQKVHLVTLSLLLAPLLENACKKHPWPVGKKDKVWLEQANSSRKSLGEFWSAMRPAYAKQCRSAGLPQCSIDDEMDIFSAHKSPKHLEEVALESEYIRMQEAARRVVIESSRHPVSNVSKFSALESLPGKENVRLTHLPTREKPKTRPDLSSQPAEGSSLVKSKDPSSSSQHPLNTHLIAVKSENLTLFLHMYPAAGEDGGRKFSWQHFLAAMADAGLSISQGSGSAVSFAFHTPTITSQTESIVDAGSIVFHRPHPVAEIHPVMMRTIGKRMNKWFDWTRDTFVEKKRTVD